MTTDIVNDHYLSHWCTIVKLQIIQPVVSPDGVSHCDRHTSTGDFQIQRVPPAAMKGWKLHKKYRSDNHDWLPYTAVHQHDRILCYYANINIASNSYNNYLICSINPDVNGFDIEIKELDSSDLQITSVFINAGC